MIFDLSAQVDQLNCAEDAFMYRLILSGLVLQYGRARLRRSSKNAPAPRKNPPVNWAHLNRSLAVAAFSLLPPFAGHCCGGVGCARL
jgi:hypothetical protein